MAPSLLVASMVAFPVKFRLHLHVLVDVLAVVECVYHGRLYRNESRLVLVLVVPALRVAVPSSLLLALGVAVP